MFAQKKLVRYYKQKRKIVPTIIHDLRTDKDVQVVYGARAINAYVPTFLHKPTRDYDIFARKPKSEARELERALDRGFGGNFFEVKPAEHRGTYRVMSRVEGVSVADYTKPKGKLRTRKLNGIVYVSPGMIKSSIRKTLKDPKSEYRHAKDRESLQRLTLWEKTKKH